MNERGEKARFNAMQRRCWTVSEFYQMTFDEQLDFYYKVKAALGKRFKMLKGKTAREVIIYGLEIRERYGTIEVLKILK